MTPASRCPSDRSELVSVLEDRATNVLLEHASGCERCQLELQELRTALALVSVSAASAPSERVRREAVSYARSQLRGPAHRLTWWRPPVAAMIGAAAAVFAGELAEARLTSSAPQVLSPEPWSLVLAAIWGCALFVYVSPGWPALRSETLESTLVRTASFTLLVLVLPISDAVELCAAWVYGPGRLTPIQALGGYAIMASLYAAISAALVSRILGTDLSWSEECCVAFVFAAMAGPLLVVQAAAHPPIAGWAGVGCLVCGSWIGGRLGSTRRS